MKVSLAQRMDVWARHFLPMGSSFFLILLTAAPTYIPDFSLIMPMVSAMCIYYWSLYRPDLMTSLSVFILGILCDFLAMFPLGITAFTFLIFHGTVVFLRRFLLDTNLLVLWSVFALLVIGVYTLIWVGVFLFYGFSPLKPMFFGYLMTAIFYPVIYWLLARLQMMLLRDV